MISREEFCNGCAILNQSLHPDCQLTQIEHTLDLMDFDGSGSIDMNEFFEVTGSTYIHTHTYIHIIGVKSRPNHPTFPSLINSLLAVIQ